LALPNWSGKLKLYFGQLQSVTLSIMHKIMHTVYYAEGGTSANRRN